METVSRNIKQWSVFKLHYPAKQTTETIPQKDPSCRNHHWVTVDKSKSLCQMWKPGSKVTVDQGTFMKVSRDGEHGRGRASVMDISGHSHPYWLFSSSDVYTVLVVMCQMRRHLCPLPWFLVIFILMGLECHNNIHCRTTLASQFLG